jgi:hypothetical protein
MEPSRNVRGRIGGVARGVLPFDVARVMAEPWTAGRSATGGAVVATSGQPPMLAEAGPVTARSTTPGRSDGWVAPMPAPRADPRSAAAGDAPPPAVMGARPAQAAWESRG